MTPRVAVLFGFGINCDHETKAVFELVGAEADRVHVNRFVSGDADLQSYDILAVPGGFSFGDHLGSGRLMGNRMRFAMRDVPQGPGCGVSAPPRAWLAWGEVAVASTAHACCGSARPVVMESG